MKLTRKQRTIIVLAIAVAFILFGLAQAIWKFEIERKIVDQVSFVLMIIAAFLIFSGRKRKSQDQDDDTDSQKQEEDTASDSHTELSDGPESSELRGESTSSGNMQQESENSGESSEKES
ncbi:MAG: hypothetical protein ACOX7R_02810 [Acetivibrionales bacterium]|jgi:ABC-type nickel/cobalt efflux system permease component RcnA